MVPQQNQSIRDKFSQISNKEKLDDTLGREAAVYGARGIEAFAGYPGNLKQAFKSGIEGSHDLLMPEEESLQQMESKAFGEQKPDTFMDFIFNPPTSHELRQNSMKKIAKEFTGNEEFFEPKNIRQKNVGEGVQDLVNMFLPGTGGMRLITRLGAPIASNLGKYALKQMGASEETADKAKLGMLLMSTMALQSNPLQFSRDMINQGKNMIPQNAPVHMGNFARRIMPLLDRLRRGFRSLTSKSSTTRGLQDIAHQIDETGSMELHSLMQARDEVNEMISEAGGFLVQEGVRDPTVRNLNALKTNIINTIEEEMAHNYPGALQPYNQGYQAASVVHRSNVLSNYINETLGPFSSLGIKVLFPALKAVGKSAAAAGAGAAIYPLYKFGQVAFRVANSPALARYYQDIVRDASLAASASAANQKAKEKKLIKKVNESVHKLDKEMAKSESKNKDFDAFKEKFNRS